MQLSYGQRHNKAKYEYQYSSGSPKDKTVTMAYHWYDTNKFSIRTVTFNEEECKKLLLMIVACLYKPTGMKEGTSIEQVEEKIKEMFPKKEEE